MIRHAEKAGSHKAAPSTPTLKESAATLIRRTFEVWDFIAFDHTLTRVWPSPAYRKVAFCTWEELATFGEYRFSGVDTQGDL